MAKADYIIDVKVRIKDDDMNVIHDLMDRIEELEHKLATTYAYGYPLPPYSLGGGWHIR